MSQAAPQSATIVKSGYLWKKGEGVLGQTYKERLFELKLTGKLDYFEVLNGTKTLKGTILLSSFTKIKRRSDDEHKFIIQTKHRIWYLWCRDNKNAKQQIDEWCSLINNMLNPSKDSKSIQIKQNDTKDITTDSFVEDHKQDPSPDDIIITRPLSPNEPFNPFYGAQISSQEDIPHYASLKTNNNSNNKEHIISNASAPPLDKCMMSNESDDVQFTISDTVSLKSSLFKSWVSFNRENGCLSGVTTSPMINERFRFKCIDPTKHIYSIQTSSDLYLSADLNGNLKFLPKMYGVYEEWIIQYHHINKISITSSYYGTHFGIDSNGLFHHKYPNITDIVLFEVSPPLILTVKERNKAIHSKHWNSLPLRPSVNNEIVFPKLMSGSLIALSCCDCYIGVENKKSNALRTNYTTFQSFDGELLTRSTFIVTQNKPFQLFAFKCALNDKYISPSDTMNGVIRFVDKLTEKEYFDVIWHQINIISLISWNGTMVKVKDNILYHEEDDDNMPSLRECSFEIKSAKRKSEYISIPRLQLPVRCVNGEIKRDIWLKGHFESIGYLAFRSKPYRFEAVSKMMGRWETLRFKHDIKRTNLNKCIVSLFTENGMIIGCNDIGDIIIVKSENVNDDKKDKYRWRILFHSYSLISIQNEEYKGWMILKKDNKTNIFVLSMKNPSFNENGKAIIDIDIMREYKDIYCQFELCPIANCKDIMNSNATNYNIMNATNQHNANVTFSM